MSKPIILVDGSSYLFRAFFALPNLTNAQGQPTGAILGVINMLRRLIKDHEPDQIAVIFDTKSKNFRHELYPQYKANRATMPPELAVQIEPIHRLIKLMGLPLVAIEGIEADDVIGSLTHQAVTAGHSVLISTGDKDMAQLIHDHVTIIDTMKNVVMDRAFVLEKFGVPPELIIDYLALMGDTSDNIPGVPKVGPKTAAKWLMQYGSLDNLKAHASEITGVVGDNLRAHLGQLDLAKQLTTIQCDLNIPIEMEKLHIQPADTEPLIAELKQWELSSWLKEFSAVPTPTQETHRNYECLLTTEQFQQWLTQLSHAKQFAIDTETTSIDAMQAELVGISFALESGKAAYLPLAHHYLGAPEQLSFEQTLAQLKPILENPTIGKIGQNIKYDLKVLARYGIELQGIVFDTMLASYVLEAGLTRHNMDDLAKRHLGIQTIHYEDVTGKGAKQISFSQVTLDRATTYAAEDADVTLQLYQQFAPKLQQTPALHELFMHEEMPVMSILGSMERGGVLLNIPYLQRQSHELSLQTQTLETQAHQVAGQPFNLASPKQLLEILYDKMQLPVLKKTPGGQPSTAEEVLEELAEHYELPKIILEHRHLSKLKSTYTDKLPLMVNPTTGRVHTHYHQAVASTGRLSSSDPNLQNIPIKTEVGRKIRGAFIAPPGYKILAADYSQIELRIMAHLSKDTGLLTAFANHEDVHRATAAEVFGMTKSEVTNEQRRRAKAINFGLIYGMSAFGLAKQLGIDRAEAQKYIDVYFKRYPGVLDYMERTKKSAQELGYVETLFGRRLYLPELQSKNGMNRKGAERAAINAPLQGTAADIIKRAMIGVDHWIKQNHSPIKMIMQVHDELVFEVPADQTPTFGEQIKFLMAQAATLDVPLVVDVGVGENWDQARDIIT